MKAPKTGGQATVEYIFILAFAAFLGRTAVLQFRNFFQGEMGKIGHALSTHLIVGVCNTECFYSGYKNGFK